MKIIIEFNEDFKEFLEANELGYEIQANKITVFHIHNKCERYNEFEWRLEK